MKPCDNPDCDGTVTDQYHRVKCDNDGNLWGCPECTPAGRVPTGPDDEPQIGAGRTTIETLK